MTILNKKIFSNESENNKLFVDGFNGPSKNLYKESSIYFAKHQDEFLVNKFRNDVISNFKVSTNYYINLLIYDYREIKKYALLFYSMSHTAISKVSLK